MVIGAMPIPAETSDTARLRRVSNQPVTQAMSGAKIAAVAPPTSTPNASWNPSSVGLQLASARLEARRIDPASTTTRGPRRSDRLPQAMLPNAMARKAIVIAAETPVMDQPVSCAIERRKTGSENMAPNATRPSRPPAATMTQRYLD